MKYLFAFAVPLLLAAGTGSARADSLVVAPTSTTGEAPPDPQRISRYCNAETGGVRFASENVILPEAWKPCGALKTVALCDASGRRVIGSADNAPGGSFRPCTSSPRIEITNVRGEHFVGMPKDTGPVDSKANAADSAAPGDPLAALSGIASGGSSTGGSGSPLGNLNELLPLVQQLMSGASGAGGSGDTAGAGGRLDLSAIMKGMNGTDGQPDLSALMKGLSESEARQLGPLMEQLMKGSSGGNPGAQGVDPKQLLKQLGVP